MGKRQSWKTCARCKNLVELSMGCNHMTFVITLFAIEGRGLTKTAAAASMNSATLVLPHGKFAPVSFSKWINCMQSKTGVYSVSMIVVGAVSLVVVAARTVGSSCHDSPCSALHVTGEPVCGVGTTGSDFSWRKCLFLSMPHFGDMAKIMMKCMDGY